MQIILGTTVSFLKKNTAGKIERIPALTADSRLSSPPFGHGTFGILATAINLKIIKNLFFNIYQITIDNKKSLWYN